MGRSSLALVALLPLAADAFLATAPLRRSLPAQHKVGTPPVVSLSSPRTSTLCMGVAQFVAAPLALANRGMLGMRASLSA